MDDPNVLMEEEPGELVEAEEVDEVGEVGLSEEDHPAVSSSSDADRVKKQPQKVKVLDLYLSWTQSKVSTECRYFLIQR